MSPDTITYCNATRKDGTPCKGYPVKDGKCYIHCDPENAKRMQEASVVARKANYARKQQEAIEREMTLQEALLRRAAEERDSLVNALFEPLKGDEKEAHRAALAILERLLGRPAQEMTVNTSKPEMALEDLVALWEQESTQ